MRAGSCDAILAVFFDKGGRLIKELSYRMVRDGLELA